MWDTISLNSLNERAIAGENTSRVKEIIRRLKLPLKEKKVLYDSLICVLESNESTYDLLSSLREMRSHLDRI